MYVCLSEIYRIAAYSSNGNTHIILGKVVVGKVEGVQRGTKKKKRKSTNQKFLTGAFEN